MKRRTILVGLLAVTSVGAGAGVAAAATAYSSWGYYGPVNGESYKNRAEITVDGNVRGSTRMDVTTPPTGVGWMGAKPRSFKNGALCKESDYSCNRSTSDNGIQSYVYGNCGSGNSNSYGVSVAWDGFQYRYYYTFQSPSQAY